MNVRTIRRSLVLAACLLAFVPVVSAADPAERLSTNADVRQVNLTIYNGADSLIHDRRRVTLDAGANDLAWRDVSGGMDATSAIVEDRTTPGATTVVEQNFNFDLLKPSTLVDKYVGRRVTVVHTKPAPGQAARESATLLAANDGIVLKYADRIETGLDDSYLVFPDIPANLRDRPTLVLQMQAQKAGARDLDLSYLTTGLGWRADYIGVLSPKEDRMDVSGLVTLTNTTGTTYPNARVQLVAGNVHEARPIAPKELRQIGRVSTADTYNTTQQDLFEYHLYTLGRPTTVADAQTKQVAFLSAKNVPVVKTLEVRSTGDQSYYTKMPDAPVKLGVEAYVGFTNKGGDLGVPLPSGIVRIYTNDDAGLSQFLGSDQIDHTPRDADVRLHLGSSFDVTATEKQTAFTITEKCAFTSSYALVVANAKDQAQNVHVVELLPGDWTIASETARHEKPSAATAAWDLRVPARASTTLAFTAHVVYCR